MKPVIQNIFVGSIEGVPGNCFQAAVASVLNLPLEGVPHFMLFSNWFEIFEEWVAASHGYRVMFETVEEEVPADIFYVLSGKSPRGDFQHSTVGYNGKMVHDPHPSNAGVLDFLDAIWFEKITEGDS